MALGQIGASVAALSSRGSGFLDFDESLCKTHLPLVEEEEEEEEGEGELQVEGRRREKKRESPAEEQEGESDRRVTMAALWWRWLHL